MRILKLINIILIILSIVLVINIFSPLHTITGEVVYRLDFSEPKCTFYNGEEYITKSIKSILNQTYENFELIIIDDGSIDSTEDKVKQFSDDRIKIYKNKKNLGIAESRNRGIDKSTGEYIAWLDSDDIAMENRLFKQVLFLENNLDYGLCCANAKSIDKDGNIISDVWWSRNAGTPLEWDILWLNPITQSSVMLRKKVLDDNKLKYNLTYPPAEDYNLWTRIVLKSKMTRVDDVLLLYRKTQNSAYHANVNIALVNSIKSNNKLLKNLTGGDIPVFHSYLTIFHQAIGYPIEFVDIDLIEKWMKKLLVLMSNKWQWDKRQINAVKKNSRNIIVSYLRRLDKKILLKNAIKLRGIGFQFFISIFFLLIKKLVKKLVV